MPAYDYRCTACGRVLEIVHRMSESAGARPHLDATTGEPCEGALERLISLVRVSESGVGQKPPSDVQLERAGFTKYVRGAKGYEKAVGPAGSPDFIQRE